MTRTVNVNGLPTAEVGVPEIVPVVPLVSSVRPGGKAPLVTVNAYEPSENGTPPATGMEAVYAVPTVPLGNVAGPVKVRAGAETVRVNALDEDDPMLSIAVIVKE